MDAKRGVQLYEGKAKRLYATDLDGVLLVEYKDDATAFNALKRGTIQGKSAVNNAVSGRLMSFLEAAGVPTHLIEVRDGALQLVKQVEIIPLEVICRNRAAGSFAKRYGVEEGGELDPTVIEWCYKNDALGDPFVNDAAAVALGYATVDELEELFELTVQVNEALKAYFEAAGLVLADFKLEFGRTQAGELVLADEISPDTCRLWDAASGEKLDKDRFRRDLGGVEEAYAEVQRRIMSVDPELVLADLLAEDHHHEHDHGAHDHSSHRAVVDVMLKRSILDPQGRAVEGTLKRLGHTNLEGVRIGKRIELSVTGTRAEAEQLLAGVGESVLSNPVMEEFTVEFLE